jgi:hypothetical protein
MTGYFITGFSAGIAIAVIFLAGKLYTYQRDAKNSRSIIDRLERFNSELQFKLNNTSN